MLSLPRSQIDDSEDTGPEKCPAGCVSDRRAAPAVELRSGRAHARASDLPQFELDPHSSIPSYFKLEVLGNAVVVPRDMPNTPLDAISKTPDYVPLTILDSRVAVPKDAHAAKIEPKQIVAIQDLPDVLDPDVLTTGEVN